MGKITALRVQNRNPNRVNIYLDGEYAFGLNKLLAARLKIGQEIDESGMIDLQKIDSVETAYIRALHFISFRNRSILEIKQRLAKNDFDEIVIDQVIDRLTNNQLAGDEEFARYWIENRTDFRPRSQRYLAMELRQKGVPDDTIESVMLETEDDSNMAYSAGKKYARRLEHLEREQFNKKLSGFLARRGFSYRDIFPVIEQIWNEIRDPEDQNNKDG